MIIYENIFLCILTCIAMIVDIRIMYVVFLIFVIFEFFKKKNISDMLLPLAICSVIVPDNYLTELIFILFFILKIGMPKAKSKKIKLNRYNILVFSFFIWMVISTFVNWVAWINVLFSIISFAPLMIMLFCFHNKEYKNLTDIKPFVDKVFYIETVATCINFVKFYNIVNDDWSTGTFGIGQGHQLFVVMAYMMIYFVSYYRTRKHDKRMMLRVAISLAIMISTHCWTMVFAFVVGVCISLLMSLKRKWIVAFTIAVVMSPLLAVVGKWVLPQGVIASINNAITNESFFWYRFHKLIVYKETYFEIPSEDIKFLLFGNGVGNYASRAALICTGDYVDFYNSLFAPSISEYTEEYILDYVSFAHEYGETDYGSVTIRPYSSLIALMGETGYVGCFLFLCILARLLKNKTQWKKMLVIIWLCFCFWENYFEYSKIILFLFVCFNFTDVHQNPLLRNDRKEDSNMRIERV